MQREVFIIFLPLSIYIHLTMSTMDSFSFCGLVCLFQRFICLSKYKKIPLQLLPIRQLLPDIGLWVLFPCFPLLCKRSPSTPISVHLFFWPNHLFFWPNQQSLACGKEAAGEKQAPAEKCGMNGCASQNSVNILRCWFLKPSLSPWQRKDQTSDSLNILRTSRVSPENLLKMRILGSQCRTTRSKLAATGTHQGVIPQAFQ